MTSEYDTSLQWAHITDTVITEDAAVDLAGFKSSSVNYKISLWDPRTNGGRYLRDLVHNLSVRLTPENRARLRRIRNRDVGDPIAVTVGGDRICMDYLQAVYELEFIGSAVQLDGLRVLEIGAGYGRTCHAVLSNHDVAAYTIVDLPNTMAISRKYLRTVLDDEQFAKITFIPNDDAASAPEHDLAVNIDSFGEMTPGTVSNYLRFVAERCRYFYTKNQVGKYLDQSLDGYTQGAEVVQHALSSGPLRDVVDIYDDAAVAAERAKFLDAYRPAEGWSVVADGWAPPWSSYWQAVLGR